MGVLSFNSNQTDIFDLLNDSSRDDEMSSAEIAEVMKNLKALRFMTLEQMLRYRHLEKLYIKRLAEEEERERLKHIEEVTSMDLPLDWANFYDTNESAQGVHADSIPDGLVLSLSNLGRVDIEYIASITGESLKDVICNLKGAIFQNPMKWNECFYLGWETAEEYLSGNLHEKYKIALEENEKYGGYFCENVEALSSLLPKAVTARDIYVTIGSPWVPTDVIDDFIVHLFGHSPYQLGENLKVTHDEITGSWEIPSKNRYGYAVGVTKTYGTSRINALHILERTLNMRPVQVTDEESTTLTKSGKRRVVNKEETLAAVEKQNKLIEEFKNWIWRDAKRKQRLEEEYCNLYTRVRARNFNGSFLSFPTMSKDVTLYPYQKNAVARILFSPNTLLAHDVGSGKTYVMVAAGMELKRLGLSKKNLYVVPNNIVGQWKDIFLMLYPQAKLLCITPSGFDKGKRQKVLKKIRDEEYDGIIMASSCFDMIPISKEYKISTLEEEVHNLSRQVKNDKKNTDTLRRKLDRAIKELHDARQLLEEENGICFDGLGVTRLFVDEAHNYKNVTVETKATNVLGISAGGSQKCDEMLEKVKLIQRTNNGGGVIMATGTPITNSITEAYILQSYLQSGQLALLGLQNFDSWVGMFAEKNTEFEVDVDTNKHRLATRFSKFHNLTELTTMLSEFADFHQVDVNDGIPNFDGYKDSVVKRTPEFVKYLDEISERADDVRSGRVRRREDNMLKITTDGRKAALDLRLVDESATYSVESKVACCASHVSTLYRMTAASRLTQLVFCDTSTPKYGFNLYDELRYRLVMLGVKDEEIAYIHDASSETRRNQIFEKMRNGDIRVLIGSTFKLGLGVNVQDRLIAVHHLDVPWRPADMTQREGRILRQGNMNPTVYIYRYITEGSFDAYSWQLLETKQRFICDLLSGSLSERSGKDIENTVLDYAEVKALAVGNPLIKLRVETANELSRYLTLQRKAVEARLEMESELRTLPERIERQRKVVDDCKADAEFYLQSKVEYSKEEKLALRDEISEGIMRHVLALNEKVLMVYQGFEIVLPVNMSIAKPYVWLKHIGKHYLPLGDSFRGALIRIDNFFDNFPKHIEKMEENLKYLEDRKAAIEEELAKNENYAEKIEDCRARLNVLNKQLGVNAD